MFASFLRCTRSCASWIVPFSSTASGKWSSRKSRSGVGLPLNGINKKRGVMKIKSLFALIAVLVLTTFSAAQGGAVSALQGSLVDAVGLPGQGWTSIGNQSPIEHNNFYLQSYMEQGAAVFSTYSGSSPSHPLSGWAWCSIPRVTSGTTRSNPGWA